MYRFKQKFLILFILCSFFIVNTANAQKSKTKLLDEVTSTMKKATRFMADSVSTNGGFLWYYLPDFSRVWGEMEAYPSMIWVQSPGTVNMGNLFLDAWLTTKDDYYYEQAEKIGRALVWGQLPEGGWNYFIDFAGQNSTMNWYHTIGKNGWRLEEFQHFYGNATFDDNTTTGAAFFLLRLYLAKLDPAFKNPLEKAISFILRSQYPVGGWPQRYPLRHDFSKGGHYDYSSYYTFNDEVQWENVKFLITCYATLSNNELYYFGDDNQMLDAIRRGMSFFLVSQGPNANAGWAQQYTMDLKPAKARTYEPASYDPRYTANNILILLKFYEMTGDERYLDRIPNALDWLEQVRMGKSDKGYDIFPVFVDSKTRKPLYIHRKGSNVKFGKYFVTEDSTHLITHYGSLTYGINLDKIKAIYNDVLKKNAEDIIKGSPLLPEVSQKRSLIQSFDQTLEYLTLANTRGRKDWVDERKNGEIVQEIIHALDERGRWLVTGMNTSNPYLGEPMSGDPNTMEYSSTFVGDKYDTSPYRDTSAQKYISTAQFLRNMKVLINFVEEAKH